MVEVFCVIVGVAGTVFSVRVDESDTVVELKDAIKTENANKLKDIVAGDLQLFLAKTANGTWLSSKHSAVISMRSGAVPEEVKALLNEEMNPTDGIGDLLGNDPTTTTIHVLVVVPKGAGGDQELQRMPPHEALTKIQEDNLRMWHKMAEELREQGRTQAKELRELKRTLERALNPATPSKSDTQVGQVHVNLLRKVGCVSDAEETVGADAFWSVEVQAQVDGIKTEDVLGAFITPYFNSALDNHDVIFVNSERYERVLQPPCGNMVTVLKRYGFITHRGMYHKEPAPTDDVSRVGTSFRFGKAAKALFDCLVLFEITISNYLGGAPFGQVMRCIQRFFPKGPGGVVLFNRTTFWLISSLDGVVVRVIKATWVMPGSKALFRDFITRKLSPWVPRLTAACSAFKVEVVEGDAFLGRGAFGRVFKVKRVGQDMDVLALKIVETSSVGRLYEEEDALVHAEDTGLAIKRVEKVTEISDGAAMLLSPVGEPIPYPTTSQEVRALFDMLWRLHSAGVVHGDPRVPNVIVKDGQRLWIDLAEWMDASPLLMQTDAKMLTQSVLHGFPKDPPDLELEALIKSYGASPTQTRLEVLADKVVEKLAAS